MKKNFHSYFQGRYYDDEDLYGSDDSDTKTRMKEPRRRNESVPHEKVNDVMVDTLIWLITISISDRSTKADIDPTPPPSGQILSFQCSFRQKICKIIG